jgi:hypothetical protein
MSSYDRARFFFERALTGVAMPNSTKKSNNWAKYNEAQNLAYNLHRCAQGLDLPRLKPFASARDDEVIILFIGERTAILLEHQLAR